MVTISIDLLGVHLYFQRKVSFPNSRCVSFHKICLPHSPDSITIYALKLITIGAKYHVMCNHFSMYVLESQNCAVFSKNILKSSIPHTYVNREHCNILIMRTMLHFENPLSNLLSSKHLGMTIFSKIFS